jgi:hypothetical protein
MQLKIRRSQRMGGVMSNNAIFCLDARAQFTGEEQQNIARYKLGGQIIYNSEASKRLLEKANAQQDGSTRGALKSLATTALVAMKLNISINSLALGQHIECKSLDELLGAERALMQACENLKSYLDAAATFDGREVLFDFSTGSPEAVAVAITPQPMLVIEPKHEPAAIAAASQPMVAVEPKQLAKPRDVATHAGEDANEPVQHDEPSGYSRQDADYEPFPTFFEQLKTTFLGVPVPVRIVAGTILLFLVIIIW